MKYYSIKYPYPCDDNTDCDGFEVVLERGYWKIECWGASGGDSYINTIDTSFPGGRGGYSVGVINVTDDTESFFFYIGGRGISNHTTKGVFLGGFNGGGSGHIGKLGYSGGSGGGGTDVRRGGRSWDHRIIVAGGGGGAGAGYYKSVWMGGQYGGYGGGINGSEGGPYRENEEYHTAGGGTQYEGGARGYNPSTSDKHGQNGDKGVGGGLTAQDTYSSGGVGGGGLFGGGSSESSGGGGGSGYIGGVMSYNGIIAQTISGNENFTSPYTGVEYGHTGNGFIRITYLNTINRIKCSRQFISYVKLLPLVVIMILFKN